MIRLDLACSSFLAAAIRMSLNTLPFVLDTLSPSNSPFSEHRLLPMESVRALWRNRTHSNDFKELSHIVAGWAGPKSQGQAGSSDRS